MSRPSDNPCLAWGQAQGARTSDFMLPPRECDLNLSMTTLQENNQNAENWAPHVHVETREERRKYRKEQKGKGLGERVFLKQLEGGAHLFPLLSRSIVFPIFVSSSCTSSSNVFLQVCLALCHKEKTIRTTHMNFTQLWRLGVLLLAHICIPFDWRWGLGYHGAFAVPMHGQDSTWGAPQIL